MNPALKIVLPPLSLVYGGVTRARLAAYRKGLLATTKLSVPVVSVGNITVGGTGKTPLVEWICRALAREGKKICVLSRGYGRANPNTRVLVSDGTAVLASERAAGDEPLLLAERLRGLAAVISDPDRVAAGKWAIENLGSTIIVLDDGFQHLRLERDLNILVIDATNPWGGGHLLPYGRLREPLASMQRADCVVITRAEQEHEVRLLTEDISRLVNHRPIFTSTMHPARLRKLESDEIVSTAPEPLGAFCGVGNPGSFFKQVTGAGYETAFTRVFADHHRYRQTEVDALAAEAARLGGKGLITTAKDAVKLRSLSFALPCFVMETQISIAHQDQFLSLIRQATEQE